MSNIPPKETFEKLAYSRLPKGVFEKCQSLTIGIAGAGGLGSNIAVCLARSGIGKLVIVDFDEVEMSNLNRQQYTFKQIGMKKVLALKNIIADINPYIEVIAIDKMVTEENAVEIFADCDMICEAFDKAESKAMLVNMLLENTSKTVIASSGIGGLDSLSSITTKQVGDRLILCGDSVSSDEAGTVASRVLTCAAHQVHYIISGQPVRDAVP